MASLLDHSIGIGVESTYGTAVTPTRWYEWSPDSTTDWDPQWVQGGGLRVGTYVSRAARRRNGYGRGTVKLKCEITSKYFGILLRACLGTGVSTVTGTALTYQQLFTTVQTGSTLPSLTIQTGIVDATGTVRPQTFAGCVCMKWSIEIPDDGGPAMLEAEFDCRSLDTTTGITTPVMPTQSATSPVDFRSSDCLGVTVGGVLVVPTTIALATGGTAAEYLRSFKVECDNSLDIERTVMGARQQPTVGLRSITVSGTAEYNDTVLTAAYLAQTSFALSAIFGGEEALSLSTASMSFAIPAVMINSGPVPTPTDGKAVAFDFEGQVLDNGIAASPLYLVLRTADSAL